MAALNLDPDLLLICNWVMTLYLFFKTHLALKDCCVTAVLFCSY